MNIKTFVKSEKWNYFSFNNNFKVSTIGKLKSLYGSNDKKKSSDIINSIDDISSKLKFINNNFAGIFEYKDYVIFFVDHIRSIPLFYSLDHKKKEFLISDNARKIQEHLNLTTLNNLSLFEFKSAGYVTGSDTVINEIQQVQAGELIYFNKKENELKRSRYFKFNPLQMKNQDSKQLIDELHEINKIIFNQIINDADGKPIWVPLSGGLDSRLIVSMLKLLGYKNLHTFTYGSKNNYETKKAKQVAKALNLPWHLIESSKSETYKLFLSNKRKDYWNYADGLSSYPVMNEFESLSILKKDKKIDSSSIIINGQTGDFTSGGHIPINLLIGKLDAEILINYIIDKHYSIWDKSTTQSYSEELKRKIFSNLNIKSNQIFELFEFAAKYEEWEWQERQAKWVVNGQRAYEFFDLNWELPFWQPKLLEFWKKVPLNLRLNQFIFKKYLSTFNYNNLFINTDSEARRWPKHLYHLIKTAKFSQKHTGFPSKSFEKYMSFWGHYSNQYALFGLKYFLKNIKNATVPPQARGAIALGILHWLKENNLELKE